MKILGINSFHANSSVALIIDGNLIYAIEEERINRIKNSGGFPYLSIISSLKYASLKLDDIDYIAVNTNPNAQLFERIKFGFSNIFRFSNIITKVANIYKRIDIKTQINSIENIGCFNGKVFNVEHHLSHIASAYYQSNFDSACAVAIDGSGDFTTTSNATCNDKLISFNHRVLYPHSLGILYSAITNYLGFESYGDEYKIMGMSAYGDNKLNNKIDELIRDDKKNIFILNLNFFEHHKKFNTFYVKNNKIYLNNLLNEINFYELFKIKKRNINEEIKQEHFDLANSLQYLYEKYFYKYLNFSSQFYKTTNLTLSGGCAMNSLANGKIRSNTNFQNIFIQPASYDAGGALGAALYLSAYLEKKKIRKYYDNFYFGDSYSNEYIKKLLLKKKNILNDKNIVIENYENNKIKLMTKLVSILLKKKILAVFRGRMEWGARALGNRSILADARGEEIKDILNKKIKKRESFRPFAPIIMQEHAKEWFDINFEVPTMMEVHRINKEKKDVIPSAVHKDGTCRLQTVSKKNNIFLYELLNTFYKETKVPVLINTSFNENEPIVSTPENALDTFLRAEIDFLLLEDFLIFRN